MSSRRWPNISYDVTGGCDGVPLQSNVIGIQVSLRATCPQPTKIAESLVGIIASVMNDITLCPILKQR
jgi:hypothetical protein